MTPSPLLLLSLLLLLPPSSPSEEPPQKKKLDHTPETINFAALVRSREKRDEDVHERTRDEVLKVRWSDGGRRRKTEEDGGRRGASFLLFLPLPDMH